MTKPKFKPKYQIGERVTFTHKVAFSYDKQQMRVPFRQKEHGEGIVTGCRRVPLGKYIPGSKGSSYYSEFEDYQQAELHVTHTQPVYLVRKSMFGKEFQVLPEDIKDHPRKIK